MRCTAACGPFHMVTVRTMCLWQDKQIVCLAGFSRVTVEVIRHVHEPKSILEIEWARRIRSQCAVPLQFRLRLQ